MNYKLFNVIMFAAGAAVGSAVTWKLLKTKYEQIAQEEIDSMRELYSDRVKEEATDEEESEPDDKNSLTELKEKVKELEYTNYSGNVRPEEPVEEVDDVDKPYVITPDDFGEYDDYERISLTYYADEILADDMNMDEIVDDIDGTVGSESLTRFGEYEEDTVYVRNDALKCDYEITLDEREYSDIHSQ